MSDTWQFLIFPGFFCLVISFNTECFKTLVCFLSLNFLFTNVFKTLRVKTDDQAKKSQEKSKIAKCPTLGQRKLKFRKKDKCLNGDGKIILSVRHLIKEIELQKKAKCL